MAETFTIMFVRLKVFGIIYFATMAYASAVHDEKEATHPNIGEIIRNLHEKTLQFANEINKTGSKILMYLQKFGYLEGTKPGAMVAYETVSSAIKDFQRFAGITQTGELNSETIEMMNTPRCGMKDKIEHSGSGRKKRYALEGSKWHLKDLTYRISKYPTRIKDRSKVGYEISRAFKMWSDVTSLSFKEAANEIANIDIRFDYGDHGDEKPFDGPGSTLAHALFPRYGGAVHFDDEETWTINEKRGTKLVQVAAHEIGHSLGLGHTDEKWAIMAPYYRGYNPAFKTHDDDIEAIQNLYGSPPSGASDICQDTSIDTVTRTQDGSTYVFKGDFYWKVIYNVTADGYPRRIADDWGRLEGNLDASYTGNDGKTFFFKGGRYWSFTNKAMDSGFPKLISVGFKGIPDMLDAALVWSGNGKPYFFKGDEYWRYDFGENPPVNEMYPLSMSEWKGLPLDGIDAAFVWDNNNSYFFKGGKYYRFDDGISEVARNNPPYPYSTGYWWFSCRVPPH